MKLRAATDIPHKLNCLIYGDPGAGKTTLACSWGEDHGQILVVNIEGGVLAVAKNKQVMVTEKISTTVQLQELFENIIHKREGYIFETIVIDSATELMTIILEEVSGGRDTIHLKDYGTMTTIMKRWMRKFRDLPCHVIVTALVKEKYATNKDGQPFGDPIDVRPYFTNKLAISVNGYFDHVWYLKQTWAEGKSIRHLLTQPTDVYFAKTRLSEFTNALTPVVVNPTIANIYQKLQEQLK